MNKKKTEEVTPPILEGMGAIFHEKGVGFRLWAPHATKVFVTGDFCEWKEDAYPLVREEQDNWYGFVPGATGGQHYLFILHNGEQVLKKPDPRAYKVEHSNGASILYRLESAKGASDFVPPTLDALVIYELHVGSFCGAEGHVGTFADAQEKIPYLRDLGINCIELMPVAEFRGDLSWGYNPAHPFAVENVYGGPEGLRAFIEAAHAAGIAVIIDVVYNHFGPDDLALWQFDGWSENDGGGIYFYNDWRAETPWGKSRPDYGRGEVRTYLRDNALMWLRNYGADGLRWDMSLFIRTCKGNPGDPGDELAEGWSLMQWINEEVHREFPRAITIAEDLRNSEWLVKDIGAGGAGFNAQWDAAFVHPIRAALTAVKDSQRHLDPIVNALRHVYDGDAFHRVIYTESHDEVANGSARMPTEINAEEPDSWAARKRALLGAALVCTAPGIPMIFQGQEFFEDEWFRDYVPLRWEKLDHFSGITDAFRALLHLRRNADGVTAGLCGQHFIAHHVDHALRILAYRRWREGGAGDDTLVVANFTTKPVHGYRVGVSQPGTWQVRLNTDAKVYCEDFTDIGAVAYESENTAAADCEQSIVIDVGPYSILILSQNQA
ncbi:MAG: alpha amylase C-terminal domain-containing protein [Puniceicoccales bacterium]|nr:alpha amylase C-terminal domain-containing protein [Puniceicoccales bacterium]